MKTRHGLFLSLSSALLGQACASGIDPAEAPQVSDLQISIAAPTDGATGVSVSTPELRATFSRELAYPELLEVVVYEDSRSIFAEGKRFHGSRKYSATNLDAVFSPFNILQANREYTFEVRAEGVEAFASFTTEMANAGAVPAIGDRTYDFRIRELTHPKELAEVFNAQLENAPPVLLHVVKLDATEDRAGIPTGQILVATSAGRAGDPMGQTQVLPEDENHPTTTAVSMSGIVEGSWLGAGPFDLHTTASGVPLVIRELFITGIIDAGADSISNLTLTGVIDPDELGRALDLDLDFVCTDEPFRQHCDEDGRLRVAGLLESASNPALTFTTFITNPINASTSVPVSTSVEVHFTSPVNAAETSLAMRTEGGAEVSGSFEVQGKSATFRPSQPLAAGTHYLVEVHGKAQSGEEDVRHLGFTTE